MLGKFLIFITLNIGVITNALSTDLPPLPMPLSDDSGTKVSPPSLPTDVKNEKSSENSSEESEKQSFIDKGNIVALPVSPEVVDNQRATLSKEGDIIKVEAPTEALELPDIG